MQFNASVQNANQGVKCSQRLSGSHQHAVTIVDTASEMQQHISLMLQFTKKLLQLKKLHVSLTGLVMASTDSLQGVRCLWLSRVVVYAATNSFKSLCRSCCRQASAKDSVRRSSLLTPFADWLPQEGKLPSCLIP